MEHALAQAARGDAAAFASLVREHQGMVFSMAYHFLHDRALAEDVAQEVFLHLYQNLRSIQSPAHLKFWLRKVASHRCIDQTRGRLTQAVLRCAHCSFRNKPWFVPAVPGDDPLDETRVFDCG